MAVAGGVWRQPAASVWRAGGLSPLRGRALHSRWHGIRTRARRRERAPAFDAVSGRFGSVPLGSVFDDVLAISIARWMENSGDASRRCRTQPAGAAG